MRSLLFTAFAVLSAFSASAQGLIQVSSSHDDSGLFTYQFVSKNTLTWTFNPGQSYISMYFDGVTEVVNPAGWSSSVSPKGQVVWSPDAVFNLSSTTPLTFQIRSSAEDITTYGKFEGTTLIDTDHPAGIAAAYATSATLTSGTLGFVSFQYTGPLNAVPEPGSIALLTVAALGSLCFMRRA